ncbi:cell envelope integrity protein CreD [Sphingomicrobium aestuariivivum]|uniref:cell envelope integrity protein CreD n=1 Tax=Sphingomicrobium aestuariivivum TaxID=1582356 RepID=UPI001FD6D142|nr:cell envelope integrity protein CreD [Sphingomicrobium aestuariivivum]MCJ8190817.1 cell envelope integrity protein CreD [Sphingomicrobium aestuariivivum]
MPLLRTADGSRTPGQKLAITILIGLLLAIPLFATWALVYDRQSESRTATRSIVEGWGDPQVIGTPVIAVPYSEVLEEQVVENGVARTASRRVAKTLTLSPEVQDVSITLSPEVKKRSIYEAVVYGAAVEGSLRFALPSDIARYGVPLEALDWDRAELRFMIADPKGLGDNPDVSVGGDRLRLNPGYGSRGGEGFFGFLDAGMLAAGETMEVAFAYEIRGNESIALRPDAGTTSLTLTSPWPHPSFTGDFLPAAREITDEGFTASYRIGNLALGKSLVETGGANARAAELAQMRLANNGLAGVSLFRPVDLYSRVDRATKYGFLHIGFTFLALLLFDVIGGRRVSAVAYLLVGAALVLFFVLLLAFAEVTGFTAAYVVASIAIAGLVTLYVKAVMRGWRPALTIGAMLAALYAALYILLGLENLSLLIGSLMLFAALAGVMYATRHLDWAHAQEG